MEKLTAEMSQQLEKQYQIEKWKKNGLKDCYGVIGTSIARFEGIVSSGEISSGETTDEKWELKYGHIPEYKDESFIFFLPFKENDSEYNKKIINSAKNYGIETTCEDLLDKFYSQKERENIGEFLDFTSFFEIRNSENIELRQKLQELLRNDGFSLQEINSFMAEIDNASAVLIGIDKKITENFEITESHEAEGERKIAGSIQTEHIKGVEYV